MVSTKLFAAALLGGLLLAAGDARADVKVAAIDMQRAVGGTNEGQRASEAIQKLSEKRDNELQKKREEFAKEQAALEKRCRSGPAARCQSEQEQLQRKMVEAQNKMVQYQDELQKLQKATEPLLTKMVAIVRRLALQNGYDLVVDQAAAPFVRADLDLTDAAIRLYNAESNVPPPAPEPKQDKGDKKKPKK